MDYNLVLGMKVKTCVNSPYLNNNGWGKVGSEFPRIYVWIVTGSKELNVTKWRSNGTNLQLEDWRHDDHHHQERGMTSTE